MRPVKEAAHCFRVGGGICEITHAVIITGRFTNTFPATPAFEMLQEMQPHGDFLSSLERIRFRKEAGRMHGARGKLCGRVALQAVQYLKHQKLPLERRRKKLLHHEAKNTKLMIILCVFDAPLWSENL